MISSSPLLLSSLELIKKIRTSLGRSLMRFLVWSTLANTLTPTTSTPAPSADLISWARSQGSQNLKPTLRGWSKTKPPTVMGSIWSGCLSIQSGDILLLTVLSPSSMVRMLVLWAMRESSICREPSLRRPTPRVSEDTMFSPKWLPGNITFVISLELLSRNTPCTFIWI